MNTERKTQVIILDDEPIVCKRLKPGLEKVGYEVEAFTHSSDAMERIKEKEFDIVINQQNARHRPYHTPKYTKLCFSSTLIASGIIGFCVRNSLNM